MKEDLQKLINDIKSKVDLIYSLVFDTKFDFLKDSEEFMNLHYSVEEMQKKIHNLPDDIDKEEEQ